MLPSAQAFTTASFAGEVPFYPIGVFGGYTRTTYAIADTDVRYIPFVIQRDCLIAQASALIACNVTVAGAVNSQLAVQIVAGDSSRFYPNALVVNWNNIDTTATGVRTAAPAQVGPFALRAGQLYWLGYSSVFINFPTLDAVPRANAAFISPPFRNAAAGANSIGAGESGYTAIRATLGQTPSTYTWVSEVSMPLFWLRVST